MFLLDDLEGENLEFVKLYRYTDELLLEELPLGYDGYSADEVWLYFENNHMLKITPHIDTSEICVSTVRWVDHNQNKETHLFKKYIGKSIKWSWYCVNSQGYRDSFMISFDDFIPELLFVIMSHTVYWKQISKVR